MKKLFLLLLPGFFACLPFAQAQEQSFRLMTINIRYANPQDGDYAWQNRKKQVSQIIHLHQPGVVGMQEVLHQQLTYLQKALPGYQHIGTGRDDGQQAGEYSPIFFRTQAYELLNQGQFWLSETPEVPGSKSWNACCTRICTWGHLREKATGSEFYVFNTHWDHQSEPARYHSARLISNYADSLAGNTPHYLIGDMNATPNERAYDWLLSQGFSDTFTNASQGNMGPAFTYVGFPYKPNPGKRIDYILTRGRTTLQNYLHTTITQHNHQAYPSDHLPVMTQFRPEKK